MKTVFIIVGTLVLVLAGTLCAQAQEGKADQTPSVKQRTTVEEIVVTASRHEEESFNSPYSVDVITKDDIQLRKMSKYFPDVLSELPSVMIQKTSAGQGSPHIRGFTGYSNLMLIDGIRLNNSVLRFGPNQYWATVDPFTIERVEVVKGPGSVLYGSDAVGGTVNALTRSWDIDESGFSYGGRTHYRYASAEDSQTTRLELGMSSQKKLSVLIGGSWKDYGDLEAGRGMGEQPHTSYDELDGDVKVEYLLTPDSKLTFAFQRVRQDDVPRTHTTIYAESFHGTTVGTERKRELTQERELAYVQYRVAKPFAFAENAKFSLSYHIQKEIEDRRKKVGSGSEKQGFDADTLGFWTQFESKSSMGRLTYGAEYYHDNVDSFKKTYNDNGVLTAVKIQGPVADDASYDLIGIYIQDEFPLAADLDATIGARYTRAALNADKVDIGGTQGSVDDNWDNVVGSARVLYHIDKQWNLFGGVSQAFRAPNLSDLTKLDETSAAEIPSPGLEPEDYLSFEVGVKTRHDKWSGEVAYWYTMISNMIVQSPTGNYVGATPEVRKDNIGDGYVHGIELETSYRPWEEWKFFGNFSWMYGKVDQLDEKRGFTTTEAPLSRLMPATLNLGVRYEPLKSKYWVESVVTAVNGQDKLALRDRTDTSRIPPDGTPGYTIYTLRSGVNVAKNVELSAAVENITDKNYRIHGSGSNEAGTNFVLAADVKF